jgi:hypothetical protein
MSPDLTARDEDLLRRRLHVQEEIDALVMERAEIDRERAKLSAEMIRAELERTFGARPALLECVGMLS